MTMVYVAIATCLVMLFGIYIAQRLGLWQLRIAKQEHDLNLRKSVPILDTTVRITTRQVNPAPMYNPFYYVAVSINNHGELAAQKLDGYWRMYSPDQSIQERTIPIARDALGAEPYDFEPCQIEGPTVERAMRGECDIRINVDIEFDYFGLSNNEPQHYTARYRYDRNSKQMVRS